MIWTESKGTMSTKKQQFGSYLRASSYSSTSKNVIFVLGYYENFWFRFKEKVVDTVAPLGEVVVRNEGIQAGIFQPDMETKDFGGYIEIGEFSNSKNPTTTFDEETIMDIPLKESKSTSNSPPFILGKAINELFFSKLSDIDQDIKKFDKEPYVKQGISIGP